MSGWAWDFPLAHEWPQNELHSIDHTVFCLPVYLAGRYRLRATQICSVAVVLAILVALNVRTVCPSVVQPKSGVRRSRRDGMRDAVCNAHTHTHTHRGTAHPLLIFVSVTLDVQRTVEWITNDIFFFGKCKWIRARAIRNRKFAAKTETLTRHVVMRTHRIVAAEEIFASSPNFRQRRVHSSFVNVEKEKEKKRKGKSIHLNM